MLISVSRSITAANGFTIHEHASAPLPHDLAGLDAETAAMMCAVMADALFSALPQLQRRDPPPPPRPQFAPSAS